jgi:hypothetical protein
MAEKHGDAEWLNAASALAKPRSRLGVLSTRPRFANLEAELVDVALDRLIGAAELRGDLSARAHRVQLADEPLPFGLRDPGRRRLAQPLVDAERVEVVQDRPVTDTEARPERAGRSLLDRQTRVRVGRGDQLAPLGGRKFPHVPILEPSSDAALRLSGAQIGRARGEPSRDRAQRAGRGLSLRGSA